MSGNKKRHSFLPFIPFHAFKWMNCGENWCTAELAVFPQFYWQNFMECVTVIGDEPDHGAFFESLFSFSVLFSSFFLCYRQNAILKRF